ncbi:hypothetical protein INR49_027258 [Caranx melampygus]|nr:hypothetical protein INR49_027258 [Caranx melampygus]
MFAGAILAHVLLKSSPRGFSHLRLRGKEKWFTQPSISSPLHTLPTLLLLHPHPRLSALTTALLTPLLGDNGSLSKKSRKKEEHGVSSPLSFFLHRCPTIPLELMPKTLEGQITMEKTPSYFVTREAPARISAMSRDTKLIVVVRDPVTRAISDYTQTLSKKPDIPSFESLTFKNRTTGLIDTSWSAIQIGIYAKHLDNWLQYFPMDQILFVSGERLISDPAGELGRVQDFLGLKRIITDKHFYFNQTKGFPCLKKAEGSSKPHCLGKTKGRTHPNIDPEVVQRLRDFYRPFNMKFYQMTGHNFGAPYLLFLSARYLDSPPKGLHTSAKEPGTCASLNHGIGTVVVKVGGLCGFQMSDMLRQAEPQRCYDERKHRDQEGIYLITADSSLPDVMTGNLTGIVLTLPSGHMKPPLALWMCLYYQQTQEAASWLKHLSVSQRLGGEEGCYSADVLSGVASPGRAASVCPISAAWLKR